MVSSRCMWWLRREERTESSRVGHPQVGKRGRPSREDRVRCGGCRQIAGKLHTHDCVHIERAAMRKSETQSLAQDGLRSDQPSSAGFFARPGSHGQQVAMRRMLYYRRGCRLGHKGSRR